nr:TPA_asm: ATP8 [Bombus citrinus]
MVFFMCLISMLIIMILINSFYIILKFKNKKKKKIMKNENDLYKLIWKFWPFN